jgi:hypothetical protein
MNIHSRDSSYRLAYFLLEMFSLSAQNHPDDFYALVGEIQKNGALNSYYSLRSLSL